MKILFLVIACFFSTLNCLGNTKKKIPIVVYEPYFFYDVVEDAFTFGPAQDYYMLSADKVYVYDRKYTRVRDNLKSIPREQREIKNIRNFENFKQAIESNDSVFFFALDQNNRTLNKFLVIKRDGKITYIDADNKVYTSLDKLIIADRGSLMNFQQEYLNSLKGQMFGRNSAIFKLTNDQEALDVFRKSYIIDYLINCNETKSLDKFMNIVTEALPDVNSEWISKQLLDWSEMGKSLAENEVILNLYTSRGTPSLFNRDASTILKSILGKDNYNIFLNNYLFSESELIAAIGYMREKYYNDMVKEFDNPIIGPDYATKYVINNFLTK